MSDPYLAIPETPMRRALRRKLLHTRGGGDYDSHLDYTGPGAPPPPAPRKTNSARRQARQTVRLKVTPDVIPPGSIIADKTMEQIEAGNYELVQRQRPDISPTYSRKPLRKKRQQIAAASRRKNRRHA